MNNRRPILLIPGLLLAGLLCTTVAVGDIKRTSSGKPDFSGVYDSGTLTPLNRPAQYADREFMTKEEAQGAAGLIQGFLAVAGQASDPERGAPIDGGDGNNQAGAGGVGGYNAFYIDIGSGVDEIDGKYRTSIIYDPPDGKQPPMTAKATMKMATNFASFAHNNDGTASWLANDGPGPFDGPESLALSERCLVAFSSGAPTIPSLYNNYRSITQTEDHVVILLEMVHDARLIRLDSEHAPTGMRKWLGDSIGHWEGDTLVVETRNFRDEGALAGADENRHVTERFSMMENGNLLYDFTVDDPTAWTAPWSGQYVWKKSSEKVYEYACHEGNYAMGNILRGARLLESEYQVGAGGEE